MVSVSVLKTTGLCWLGWVFDFYDLILIAFLIGDIEHSLHITPEYGVWLLGIGLGASGIGGILFGALADHYGRKPMLTLTVLLFSSGMLLTGFVQSPEQFLAVRALTGLGLGGEWAIGHALVAESVPAELRGRWSARLQSGEPIGVGLAAIMGFLATPLIGWRWVFILSALPALLTLIFRKHLSESPVWLNKTQQRKTETASVLTPSKLSFVQKHWSVMLLAFILATLKLGTYWTCYTWLPRFIKEASGLAIAHSALWILCGQLGQFVGMHCFGELADRWGRRLSFTLFSLLTALALIPLACFWTPLWKQPLLFWGLFILLGFGSGCTAGFGALLAELFPTQQRTFAMGSTYNLARAVQLFAPVLVGAIVVDYGIQGALLVPSTLALLTALWVWTLPERRGQPITH